jgi:hypothetical protein
MTDTSYSKVAIKAQPVCVPVVFWPETQARIGFEDVFEINKTAGEGLVFLIFIKGFL